MTLESEKAYALYDEAFREWIKAKNEYLRTFKKSKMAQESRERQERLSKLLALARKEYRLLRREKVPPELLSLEVNKEDAFENFQRLLSEESKKEEKRGKTK